MPRLSLAMIAKNAEETLARCLASVAGFADEIIVADTGSSDRTREIAESFGAKVIDAPWESHFAKARNKAMEAASGEWILVLDADEELTMEARSAISRFMERSGRVGCLKIVNKVESDGRDQLINSYIPRLMPKGVRYKGRIHEQPDTGLPLVDLEAEVLHDGYYKKDKSERNLKLLLQSLEEEPENPYLMHQLSRQYKASGDFKEASLYFQKGNALLKGNEPYAPSFAVNHLYNALALKDFKAWLSVVTKWEQKLSAHPDFYLARGLFYTEYILSDPGANANLLPEIEKSYLKCLQIGENKKQDGTQGTGSFLPAYNLGVFYELLGHAEAAKAKYAYAASLGYAPASERLAKMA